MIESDALDIASDRLDGAEAIARFRGEALHQTRYLIRRGLIPVARIGQRIIASKRVLREHYLASVAGKRDAPRRAPRRRSAKA